MKQTKHKILSVFLSFCMIISCMVGMSLTAYAASNNITISAVQYGTVTASVNGSAATSAEEGATVTLTANPDNGYRLKSISGTYKGNTQETKGLSSTKTINGTYFNLSATDAAGAGWSLKNNSTITITSKDSSVKIDKVDFNIQFKGSSFNLNNVSCSAGTKSLNGNTLSVSSINGTTVTLSSSANNAGAVRFNSVTIYGTGAVDTNLTISTTGDVNVRTFTMPAVVQGDVTITPVFEEIPKYNVTLNGGANATTSGGNTTQTGVTGAMTTVTYTANSGYHFTEFVNITNNGITATRTSDTVVTVSGTPTADASITIPDAVLAHTHSFNYSVNGATITATCSVAECPLNDSKATLTLVKPTLTTYGETGKSATATLTGLDAFNSATGLNVQASSIIYWNAKIQDGEYKTDGDQPLTAAPTSAGNYLAKITVNNFIAAVGYTINKADPTAPTGLTATYGQTLADVTLPTGWTWADSTQSVGNIVLPAATFKANFAGNDNYNSASNVDVAVTVSKAANPAKVTGPATVKKGGTVDLSGNVTLNDATGNVTYEISGEANGCTLNGSVLTAGNTAGRVTVNVTVAEDDNHEALTATPITVTITDHTHTMTHYSASSGNCQTRGHIEYWYCSGCGKYFNDAEGASEIESSSIYTGYGSHSYSSKITTEPTCTEAGVRTYTCSVCGDSYTSTVKALGHKYDPDTHICERCNELDPDAFPAYKTAQKKAADALAETTDSEASKKLITDAKAAIDAVTYDETKTFAENAAVIDAIIEQLKTDLAAQRAKDALLREFDAYKTEQKAAADALGRDTDSAASKALITTAKAAIDALTYDAEKTLDDNKALVDAIIEQLKSDLAAQRIKDDAEGEFARYKTERKEYVSSLAETGDSDKCKELITKAKADIDAVVYNSEKTFEQNKAAVDKVVSKLSSDLAKQRNDDNYETYKNEFEAYKTSQKSFADTLANDTTNVNEKSIIDKAKAAIAALTYDKSKSLADNKARVDTIIEQLKKDIAAYWETVTLTVKFDSCGGTEVEPVTVSYGKTVSAPTVEKTGYNFVNWSLDGAEYDFTKPVTSNLTLVANWTPIKYNVIFMVNGVKHSEQVVEHGRRVTFPEITVSEGKKLFGWALDKELTIGFTAITPVTEHLVLYAEERDAAKVLIDGEKTDTLDTALAALSGEDDFINLYEDQELKKLKFPKGDTAIVISGNGNALDFTGAASLAPKQELALDDITIKAENAKGKAQNITLTAAAGGLSLSDVTLDGKNANIKGTKGNITLGDIDSSKCAQLNVTGNKKTTLDIEGDVDATKVTGFGTLNVTGTLTIDKTLTVNELYLADGAVLNIAKGATVTIKNSISGAGTIHLASGFKPITIGGTVSGHITITAADGTLENKQIFKAKATNLNDVFDISAIVPAVTDGEYEYGLYTKSGKVYLYAYKFAVNDTTYAVWADAMKAITNLKASDKAYTFELLGNVDLGPSFTLPTKGKYAGLTIYGNGHTITFKSSSITLTADLTLRDITLNATAKNGCTIKLNKFKLDTDESVTLNNCTQK